MQRSPHPWRETQLELLREGHSSFHLEKVSRARKRTSGVLGPNGRTPTAPGDLHRWSFQSLPTDLEPAVIPRSARVCKASHLSRLHRRSESAIVGMGGHDEIVDRNTMINSMTFVRPDLGPDRKIAGAVQRIRTDLNSLSTLSIQSIQGSLSQNTLDSLNRDSSGALSQSSLQGHAGAHRRIRITARPPPPLQQLFTQVERQPRLRWADAHQVQLPLAAQVHNTQTSSSGTLDLHTSSISRPGLRAMYPIRRSSTFESLLKLRSLNPDSGTGGRDDDNHNHNHNHNDDDGDDHDDDDDDDDDDDRDGRDSTSTLSLERTYSDAPGVEPMVDTPPTDGTTHSSSTSRIDVEVADTPVIVPGNQMDHGHLAGMRVVSTGHRGVLKLVPTKFHFSKELPQPVQIQPSRKRPFSQAPVIQRHRNHSPFEVRTRPGSGSSTRSHRDLESGTRGTQQQQQLSVRLAQQLRQLKAEREGHGRSLSYGNEYGSNRVDYDR